MATRDKRPAAVNSCSANQLLIDGLTAIGPRKVCIVIVVTEEKTRSMEIATWPNVNRTCERW
jgi:hypothetical protein